MEQNQLKRNHHIESHQENSVLIQSMTSYIEIVNKRFRSSRILHSFTNEVLEANALQFEVIDSSSQHYKKIMLISFN